MVGPSLQHQESHVYMRDFKGCRWALLQWFDFQRKLKILSGNKFKGSDFPFPSQEGDSTDMDSNSSTSSKHSSWKRPSGKPKKLLKSFIPKKFYRKQDQKQKILPLSPQLLRTISIHHLEPKNAKPSSTSTSSNVDITAADSSSRNENDSLLPGNLNVIQEKFFTKSYSLSSEIQRGLKSTDTSTASNQNRPRINKSLKQMITMDSVLHKIPYGQKLSEYSKFSTNSGLFRSISVTYDREGSQQMMKRSRSLSDSVGRYSQLIDSLSRESTQKTMQASMRLTTDKSFKELNTLANNTSEGKDSSSSASESVLTATELTKDGLFEEQNGTSFSLQVTNSISSASKTVVDDMRLNKEEYFRESEDATYALLDGFNSIPSVSEFVQCVAKGVDSGSETLETSDECEDLGLAKEKGEFVAMQDEAGPHVSDCEIFQKSSVSILDSGFLDGPIPAKFQDLKESSFDISGPNVEDISCDSKTYGENANSALANFDILPPQLVQGNEAELDNLKDLFENFGFSDGDFLEIIDSLLQEVRQENDKIPSGYDFTKFDHDFGGFDYDENMSLDQNILYALTHEALRENHKKYVGNSKLSSYTMVPNSNSLQDALIKDLWGKLSCYVNSEIFFCGKNFGEGIIARDSVKNDGWLNYSIERELLGVELGDEIFDSIINEIICEAC